MCIKCVLARRAISIQPIRQVSLEELTQDLKRSKEAWLKEQAINNSIAFDSMLEPTNVTSDDLLTLILIKSNGLGQYMH